MAPLMQVLPGDENAAPENREPKAMKVMKAVCQPAVDAIEGVRKQSRKRSASELLEDQEPAREAAAPPSKRARLGARLHTYAHAIGSGCLRRASSLSSTMRGGVARQAQNARRLVPSGVSWSGMPSARSLYSKIRPIRPVAGAAETAVASGELAATETVAPATVDHVTTAAAAVHSDEGSVVPAVSGDDAPVDNGVEEDACKDDAPVEAATDLYADFGEEALEAEAVMVGEVEEDADEEDVALVVHADLDVEEDEMVYAVDDDYDGDIDFEATG
mmetsp:Transcript_30100/g.54909  ORF Transcript_30100/g.54909 Transcript_30100/m.54909 type:complete len:274 (-) Transcript_30100:87-908(-)